MVEGRSILMRWVLSQPPGWSLLPTRANGGSQPRAGVTGSSGDQRSPSEMLELRLATAHSASLPPGRGRAQPPRRPSLPPSPQGLSLRGLGLSPPPLLPPARPRQRQLPLGGRRVPLPLAPAAGLPPPPLPSSAHQNKRTWPPWGALSSVFLPLSPGAAKQQPPREALQVHCSCWF